MYNNTGTLNEELITTASLDALEKALNDAGYDVSRGKKSLSASKRSVATSRSETISIIDKGEERVCHWNQTSQWGWFPPKPGKMGEIIAIAEVNDNVKTKQHNQKVIKKTQRFCEECGKKLSPTAKFCPNCGTKVK